MNVSFGQRIPTAICNVLDTKENKYVPALVCELDCRDKSDIDRIAAIEILTLDDNLKDLIIADRPANEIRRAAFESGYRPLVVDAFNKVLQGHTTISEVKKKLAY